MWVLSNKNASTISKGGPSYSPLGLQDSQAPTTMPPGVTSWRIQDIHSNAPYEHTPDHKNTHKNHYDVEIQKKTWHRCCFYRSELWCCIIFDLVLIYNCHPKTCTSRIRESMKIESPHRLLPPLEGEHLQPATIYLPQGHMDWKYLVYLDSPHYGWVDHRR